MTNWPPPSGEPVPEWGPPQGSPSPNGQPPSQGWPAPQQQPQQSWQPQQPPQYWQQQPYGQQTKTAGDRALEWTVPINRSGLAIAAGYVALLSFPILIAAPIGVLLGVLALRDITANPGRLGKGRAWFAIVYGGLGTIALLWLLTSLLLRSP